MTNPGGELNFSEAFIKRISGVVILNLMRPMTIKFGQQVRLEDLTH